MADWNADAYHRISIPQQQWGRRVLERLQWRGDETVLDAGCGTGQLTAIVLERVPRGRVIAIDRSAAAHARLLAAEYDGQKSAPNERKRAEGLKAESSLPPSAFQHR